MSDLLKLEELVEHYPATQALHRSSSFGLIRVPVGVFRSLPHRAHLFLEVPFDGPYSVPPFGPYDCIVASYRSYVPDVRAWALWEDGTIPRAFHGYPDGSMCAHMPSDWIWGRDPLHKLVDWCVVWLGKVLYLEFFDHWPGPHHCSANVRVKRSRPDDYCGCGGTDDMRWRDCHMAEDLGRSPYDLLMEEERGRTGYLWELQRRGWDPRPPWDRGV